MQRNSWIRHRALWIVAGMGLSGALAIPSCQSDFSGTFTDVGDFLATGRTLSHFTAIQVDPRNEDSAGPQFVVAEDVNGDGLTDLISAWNQSQPVQIHLQRRSESGGIRFETITLAGNVPVVRVAGLAVTDFDLDGRPDVAVLVKQSGLDDPACLEEGEPAENAYSGIIIVYFGPADPTLVNQALAWDEVLVESSRLAGRPGPISGPPEEEGYTSLAVGDMDRDGDMDLVAAYNSACAGLVPEVLLFTNLGRNSIRQRTWTAMAIPDEFPKGPLLADQMAIAKVKDVVVGDIDGDGDLDIVASFPDAGSLNIRWYRNPAVDIPDDFHISDMMWQTGTVAQIEPRSGFDDLGGADALRIGDIDRDGILDVVVRSSGGRLIQWLKGPAGPTTAPLRHIPWQVYTIAEFKERIPEGIALGDVNFDGQLDVIASAEGGVAWFNASSNPTLTQQWIENLIVDDVSPGRPNRSPATTDPNVAPTEVEGGTFVNWIQVVDLDGDGANDIIVTLDRSGLSGLSNDALVWFRNTRRP